MHTGTRRNRQRLRALHRRSKVVAEILGAKDVFMYSLPDNRFDTLPMLDVVKIIEGLVLKLQPAVVLCSMVEISMWTMSSPSGPR